MSIVQLKSSNPKMSWVISKNPESGMLVKSVRLGKAFGWFKDGSEDTYNIYFKDAEDEISYKTYEEEQFEYLNATRYNSALFIVNIIDDFLRSTFKTKHELDVDGVYKNKFFINMVNVKNERYITAFVKYFDDYTVDYEKITGTNYRVTITTENSIHELLNFAALFGIFNAIVNDEPIYVQGDVIQKYLKCINNIDAPYFMRYLFKIRFIRGESQFNKVKDILAQSSRADIKMTFGDNWLGRQIAVEDRITFRRDILDIGCGEGKYITRFANKIKGFNYYAIDVDKDELDKAKKRVFHKKMDNVHFFDSLKEFTDSGVESEFDVVLTEVVEHMPKEEAVKFLAEILKVDGVKRVVITTPDYRFNENYFIAEDQKFRHDDHDWEPTKSEFQDFIDESRKLSGKECTPEWFAIGDSVNGVTPTQGCVIELK